MSSTPSSQSAVPGKAPESVPSAIIPADSGLHRASAASGNAALSGELGPRRVGYGLPCMKCKTYYAADLSACPVCQTKERVLPIPLSSARSASSLPESLVPAPDDPALEEERERFLREFKARVYASEPETEGATGLTCSLEDSHLGELEQA